MALETGGVDPGAVSTILNRLKSQGIFDQFRRDCLADVDTKPAYQNLRQRVESYVSNFLSRFTWTPEMNKNQLRDRLRRQINQSDMLASGVDRIIEQVVEPKMQHVFRPQIEKVVNQYLHSETIVNGDEEITKKNGTVMDDLPPINTTEVPMMTPPEERVFNTSPDVPSPPPEQPPLPPTPAIDDDEKMPPPPQPPPPPLPPSSEELTINTEGPVILPSPAFEPIGSSPPHPGASFLNKDFVDSPIPEPLSDGLPEQMDFSQSPDQGSFKGGKHVTDPTDVKSLLSRTVLAKKAAGRSMEGDLTSPQTSDLSPVSDGMSSYTNERKFDTRQAGPTKGTKYTERDSSSSSSSPKSRAKLAADGSPGTWSTKSSTSLPKIGKRDNLEGSPGSLSTPSTPEKTVKSEYERKLEIKRKVKNLIKQNIKIRDKRDSSESSGGDSSPDVRFRGDSEHRRTTAATPSPDRHRKDYRSPEKKSRSKRSWEQMVRPEDALRAISPEVISDEELEKKSVKDASDVERSEGELVSSEEDGKKDLADLGNLSDITVSSVHTSDLSSFSDVSSSSSTSGSDNEDERKAKESSGPTTNLKSIPKQYQSKAFPPHFDSSEDEATREERKKRAAVAKEERVRRRQLQKEEKEKQLRLAKSRERESKEAEEKPAEKRKIDDDLSPVSTDTDSRDEMGDSPEAREADVTAKPVKKRRRSSEEEKPQVEVYPTYVTSTSKRKRRQASVKDSFLLTQNVSGAKLLKRRKKKVNNRSGSKLFFRMGGQSGGNTPKRSASPRMGGPSVSQPEGHLVSKAVAKLEETQKVSDTLLEASSVQAERRGKWQRDTDGDGRVEIVPVLNKFASNVPRAGTVASLSSIAIQQSSPAEEDYRGATSYVKGGQNFAVNQRTRHPAKDNVPAICRDQEVIHEETTLIGSEVDVHDAAKENASVEQDVRPDDSSSGPATPLMDETEEESREKDEDDERMEENEDLEISEGWKEDEMKQSGGERTEERKPMEESLVSTMEDKQQQGGVRDVSDGMLERKDVVRECKETDMSMADSKAGETSAMYSADMAVDTGEKCISEPTGSISEPPSRISEPPGVDGTALETCSSGTVDGGPKETWEGHQIGEQKVTARTDHARTAVQEQSCKVVLHDIQLQPGLAESAEVSAEEGEKMSVRDEGAVTVGVVGGSDGKVSWVEELEEGIVEVHGEVVDEEVEDDNPPTPTQDELVDTGEEEEELMVGTTEEFQEEGEMGDHASLGARGVIGDYQGRDTTESITTAEERRPTSEIDQGGASQETTSVTDQADSVPASEVAVGRRSRRSVSDRHSKDEDFVYFGIRRKSRQKSQSPTPSLQSNESESSHTSSRSSRSSRRNSGRSADTEEKKSEVTAIRKRHASQELPSTSVGEDRPRRSRRSSPPNRYSPSESATQRLPKRRKSPSPTPQSQHEVPSRRTSKREHYTRHSTSSNRDSDFIYDMPKRRSDRNSIEERPPKRKR